jgi:hypothetical protein
VQQAVCDLGTLLHPVDLAPGTLQDAAQVATGLQGIVTRMTPIAQPARLGERSRAALRTAAPLVPSWAAAVARGRARVDQRLADLAPPVAVVAWVRNVLIRAGRARGPVANMTGLTSPHPLGSGAGRRGPLPTRHRVLEGRTGDLSLHPHPMPGLGPALLTVVHNFVITRTNGTTAAVRFFGRAPEQALFAPLGQLLPLPARPQKRSRHPEENIFCLAT